MYIRPINKNVLIHKVKWYQTKINTAETEGFDIDHVRIYSNMMVFNDLGQFIQGGLGNYCVFYDMHYSTPLPEGKTFSVGDVFIFDQYPSRLVIRNVRPIWAEGKNSDKPHHYEIWCD